MKRFSILCLVAMVSFGLCAFAADWPRFLGPDANGISAEKGINKAWNEKKPAQLWLFKMGDNGFAGPSVADGKLFIIDRQGDNDVVRALEFATGKPVWEYAYPAPGQPDQGGITARSTPTFDNGKIYTISRFGLANCLSAKDGKKIWTVDIKDTFKGQQPMWKYSMSPLIDGNNVILVPGGPDAAVVALNKETGETVWKGGGSDRPGYATPAIMTINGKKQYVVFMAESVIGVDAANGKLIWTFPWVTKPEVNAAMPILIGEDTVFITSDYKRGCAALKIARDKVEKLWENKEMQSHFSTPILFNGNIYGGTDPGDLVCLDPKTGKSLWRQGGFEKGGIIIVDGTIIAMNGKEGDVIMVELKPDACKELGRFKPESLGGKSWTAPVVSDLKLIVRNQAALAVFDLK